MRAESQELSALMDSYANGNDVVFEPLYALLAPRLYRFCLRLTARRADADDCFQETLLKLHRARATYVQGANALCWAFAIARSLTAARKVGALGMIGLMPAALAQTDQQQAQSRDGSSGIVREVRQATREFQTPENAVAAGYVSTANCVSGPNEGAMGVHYVNEALIADGALDVRRPEVLVYEPVNGQLRLAAVEFFVPAELWNAANAGPPVLGGQLFNFVGDPNRLRNPAYYELHVWAWKRNPNGVFSDWNPTVSCAQYAGEAEPSAAAHGH